MRRAVGRPMFRGEPLWREIEQRRPLVQQCGSLGVLFSHVYQVASGRSDHTLWVLDEHVGAGAMQGQAEALLLVISGTNSYTTENARAAAIRSSVARRGRLRADSYAATVGCNVPARQAISTCVNPARARSRRIGFMGISDRILPRSYWGRGEQMIHQGNQRGCG